MTADYQLPTYKAIYHKAVSQMVPGLIYAFTFSLPLLHFASSRVYNFRIAIVELVILAIAFSIYRKDLFLHFKKQSVDTVLIYLFFISGLISTLNSDFLNHSLARYLSIIVWFSYFWLMVFLIRKKKLSSTALIFLISISTLIPIIHLLVIYSKIDSSIYTYPENSLYNYKILKFEIFSHLYYYSNIRHFGFHLTSATLISFFFLLEHKITHYKSILGYTLIGVNFSILFWTASRQGVFISLIFGFGLLFYINKNNGIFKNFIRFSIFIFITIAITHIMNLDIPVLDRIITGINSSRNIYSFLGERAELWKFAFTSINERWFFGIGPDSFAQVLGIKYVVQPHSIIFQALSSWGLIGYLLIFSIFGRLLFIAIKALINLNNSGHTKFVLISSTLIFSTLLNATIDGNLYHGQPIYIFSVLSAILVSTQNRAQ